MNMDWSKFTAEDLAKMDPNSLSKNGGECDLNGALPATSGTYEMNKENMNEGKQGEDKDLHDADHLFVAVNDNKKLGSLMKQICRTLRKRGGWKKKKTSTGRYHLLFGEAQGMGIPYARFAQCFRYDYGITPLVNYYKGFRAICRKTQMVTSLRKYAQYAKFDLGEFVPETFLFFPSKPETSEVSQFCAAFDEAEAKGTARNVWILKPSDGAHGDKIELMDNKDDILSFMESKPEGSIAWVAQKYITNPMLLDGGRKFDIRVWVLLDHNYNIHVYKQGVLRTSSVPFSLDDLKDKFAHLSNHCIQAQHADYGKFDGCASNEMFFDQFDAVLDAKFNGAKTVAKDIRPQIDDIVKKCLVAVKGTMEGAEHNDYKAFNVFGFDFLVDENCTVHLLEANSSPAVAEDLLGKFAEDVVTVAIDPVFKSSSSGNGGGNFEGKEGEMMSSSETDFECIYTNDGESFQFSGDGMLQKEDLSNCVELMGAAASTGMGGKDKK